MTNREDLCSQIFLLYIINRLRVIVVPKATFLVTIKKSTRIVPVVENLFSEKPRAILCSFSIL